MYDNLIILLLFYIHNFLPTINSSFTINGNFIYNVIAQNICSNAFITLPFCTGNSSNNQCFNLIFDINSKYIMLINKNVDHIKGYDFSLSDKYNQIPNTIFVDNINHIGTLKSFLIQDSIYIKEINTSINNVSMLELNEIDFDYPRGYHSGLIGFNSRNEMGDNFVYLKKLLINNAIPSMNYYYTFSSLSKVNFTIGIEDNDPIINSFTFCQSPRIAFNYYSLPWRCIFNSLSNANSGEVIKELTSDSNTATFNTMKNGIYAPVNIGIFILREYEKVSNNNCKIVKDNEIQFIKCNLNFNYEILPVFRLEDNNGFKIKLYPVDIFNYTSGESYLKVIEGSKKWIIDLNILKHYDVFVHVSDNKIGFRENDIFLSTNNFMSRYYEKYKYNYIQIVIKSELLSLLSGIFILLLTSLFIKD